MTHASTQIRATIRTHSHAHLCWYTQSGHAVWGRLSQGTQRFMLRFSLDVTPLKRVKRETERRKFQTGLSHFLCSAAGPQYLSHGLRKIPPDADRCVADQHIRHDVLTYHTRFIRLECRQFRKVYWFRLTDKDKKNASKRNPFIECLKTESFHCHFWDHRKSLYVCVCFENDSSITLLCVHHIMLAIWIAVTEVDIIKTPSFDVQISRLSSIDDSEEDNLFQNV